MSQPTRLSVSERLKLVRRWGSPGQLYTSVRWSRSTDAFGYRVVDGLITRDVSTMATSDTLDTELFAWSATAKKWVPLQGWPLSSCTTFVVGFKLRDSEIPPVKIHAIRKRLSRMQTRKANSRRAAASRHADQQVLPRPRATSSSVPAASVVQQPKRRSVPATTETVTRSDVNPARPRSTQPAPRPKRRAKRLLPSYDDSSSGDDSPLVIPARTSNNPLAKRRRLIPEAARPKPGQSLVTRRRRKPQTFLEATHFGSSYCLDPHVLVLREVHPERAELLTLLAPINFRTTGVLLDPRHQLPTSVKHKST